MGHRRAAQIAVIAVVALLSDVANSQAPPAVQAPAPAQAPPPAPPPPPVQAPTPVQAPERLYLLYTADGRGDGLTRDCGGADSGAAAGLARLAAAVEEERRWAAAQGLPQPLLLDAGDALFPSRRAAWVASTPAGAKELARLVKDVGYDALATGNTTLAAPVAPRDHLLDAMKAGGLPMLASNVRCADAPSSAGCLASVAGRVAGRSLLRRGERQVGVFSLLPSDLPERMARSNSAGVKFADPVETARGVSEQLRKDGAGVVVLLSHLDRSATSPRLTLSLLTSLAPGRRPDLTIAASTASFTTHIGDPRVVAVAPGRLGRTLLRKGRTGWEIEWTDTVPLPAAPDPSKVGEVVGATSKTVDRWASEYCAEHARPLRGGALTAPLTADGFRKTVLEVMRRQTASEIALINTAVVEEDVFPLQGRLNAEQLRSAIPYDNKLRTITLRGYELELVFGALAYSPRGTSVGLGVDATGRFTVNGRLIDPGGPYKIVTLDFVASGGDGILRLPPDRWRDAAPGPGGDELLTDRLIRWFDVGRGEAEYDPAVVHDLHQRPLWFGRSLLSVTSGSTFIDDPTGYYLPSLARQGIIDLNFGANVDGGVSTRDHKLLGSLDVQYGRQRLETFIGSKEHEWYETNDYLRGRTSYSYEHLRNVVLGGAWYAPAMFVEGQVETEFEPATRETVEGTVEDERYFEGTTTTGVRFDPSHELSVQTGGGVRSPLLRDDPPVWPVANVRTHLKRLPFFAPTLEADPTGMLLLPPVHISLAADYWFVSKDAGANHRLDASATLEVALVGSFSFLWSASTLVYVEPGGEVAYALDNYVGINLAVAGRHQQF